MHSWGSEFSDDGSFGKLNEPSDDPIHDLWLPMHILDQIVDKRYLGTIQARDAGRIDGLLMSIQANGMREPGMLVYDQYRMRLQEGNHRYLCAKRLGWERYPVVLQRVGAINAPSIALDQLVPLLVDLVLK